jgi:UDP-glucose 4-epimerase
LASFLLEKGYHVIALDNLSTGSRNKLPVEHTLGFTFIKADCNDYRQLSQIMLSRTIDDVFHYAAMVGVQRTLNHPIEVLKDIDGGWLLIKK